MFERNRVDSAAPNQKMAVPAEITCQDGEVLKGKFFISSTRQIFDVLNSPDQFLEFEEYNGDRRLISKGVLSEIKLVNAPPPPGLSKSLREIDNFDPYAILGVDRAMSWDEIRQSYLKLAKVYHPDTYAGAQLPTEVRDYMSAMARRINSAFEALEAPRRVVKRVQNKSQPVFTSAPRA